jgi:squalene-hopene/tetraprenyl-beta-curcumene cyclase
MSSWRPMTVTVRRCAVLAAVGLGAGFCALSFRAETSAPLAWDKKAAATYLDDRQTWWMNWSGSARDHQTFCVSCHTVLPYALARPALRAALGESTPSINERKLLDNVTKRVMLWAEVEPFYSNEKVGPLKTPQSRGTESVLNALILSTDESQNAAPSPALKKAFQNMWSEQQQTGEQKGSWIWLNFRNEPWEAEDSPFFGAALAAIAIGRAPADYRTSPEIQSNVQALRGYLQRNYATMSLNNRLMLLWASAKLAGLLTPEQQKSVAAEVLSLQREDGGWSASTLFGNWKRRDGTPLESKSDGYATGIITLVLPQTGVPHDNPQLKKGLAWLATHQDKSQGLWAAYSLNRQRDPSADGWLFMSDAATAYSVLALTQAQAN